MTDPAFPFLVEVAPFTGAGIETARDRQSCPDRAVAPFTGAGIETQHGALPTNQPLVAPFTGAGIETSKHQDLSK